MKLANKSGDYQLVYDAIKDVDIDYEGKTSNEFIEDFNIEIYIKIQDLLIASFIVSNNVLSSDTINKIKDIKTQEDIQLILFTDGKLNEEFNGIYAGLISYYPPETITSLIITRLISIITSITTLLNDQFQQQLNNLFTQLNNSISYLSYFPQTQDNTDEPIYAYYVKLYEYFNSLLSSFNIHQIINDSNIYDFIYTVKYQLLVETDENINNKSFNTRKLWIGGHSKGGNLAVFAAMHVDKEVQDVIIKVFNFDGPGFNHKMIYTAGYKRIFDRIETFLPQSSIVGLLLEHVDDYEVVRSRNSGPLQHDAFSWEIMGSHIIKADGLDKNSVRLDKTLRNWIGSMDEAQRKQFVNVLFSIASDSNFENLDQMSFKQLIEMIKAADELSKADWSILKDTVRLLISAGVGVVRDEKEK